MKRYRWLEWLLLLALVVTVASCGDDDDDDGAPQITFRQATAADLANKSFTFTDLFDDPAITSSTLTVGNFSGAPETASISIENNDGSLLCGTLALGSCTATPTLLVTAEGEVVTGEDLALPPFELEEGVFDPCEISTEGSLRLTDAEDGTVVTSEPGTAATPAMSFTVPLAASFHVEGTPELYQRAETGMATLTLYPGNLLSYDLVVDNLEAGDALTVSHIHTGDVVTNGGVFVTLAGGPTQPDSGRTTVPSFDDGTSLSASAILTPAEAEQIVGMPSDYYVNVHSTQFGAGLVRGQLRETIDLAFNVPLAPTAAATAAERTETGFATLRLLADGALAYRLRVDELSAEDALTNAHIHTGASAEDGPIYLTLVGVPDDGRTTDIAFDGATDLAARIQLTQQEIADLGDDALPMYVQIHSVDIASGLARGQIRDAAGNAPPTAVADASPDPATSGDTVTLSSLGSSDTDGTITGFSWVQVPASTVTLNNAATATATFTAPSVTAQETLTFELTVTDNGGATDTTSVTVTVNPAAAVGDPIAGGQLFLSKGCGTSTCHGPTGAGGTLGPNIQGETAAQLLDAMTAFAVHSGLTLSQSEADDISAFLDQSFVSFATQIQPIFTNNCTVSICHVPNSPQGSPMSLEEGVAHGNLADHAATNIGVPGTRVIPFDSSNSVLSRVLKGTLTPQMPLGGTPLPQGQIDLVDDWIDQGAPDN